MLLRFEIVRWFWLVLGAGVLAVGVASATCIAVSGKFWGYSRRQALRRLALAVALTGLLWPVCVIRHPVSESYVGMSRDTYAQFYPDKPWPVWNYYGLPFPLHRSHAYLAHLTMSIHRFPIVESVFLNVVFWFLLFHCIRKPTREDYPDSHLPR